MITLVLAIVADPACPQTAARWNILEPRGDDILFVGIVVFAPDHCGSPRHKQSSAGRIGDRGGRVPAPSHTEAAGKSRGALEAVGPLLFVVLIATMAVLSFRGVLRADPRQLRESTDIAES